MPLPTFLQRKKPEPAPRRAAAAAPEAEDSGALQAARTRARRRLIGAVVLLAVGVVVFPLVFETQPRPVATDLPIEVPARKDSGSVSPAPRAQAKRPQPVTEAPAEAPAEPAPQAAAPASAAAEPAPAPQAAASKPAERVAAAPVKPSAPAPKPPVVAKAEEAQRAKSLLEGKPAAAESKEGRFVVQVGAFTDAAALKEARQRVEKLGLKTYTQVVETEAGKRTRVRVGPFATREEADHAAAKLKSAALPAAVLTL